MEPRILGTSPQARPASCEARLLLLWMLGALVVLGLITECMCFKGPTPSVPLMERSHIEVLHRPLGYIVTLISPCATEPGTGFWQAKFFICGEACLMCTQRGERTIHGAQTAAAKSGRHQEKRAN